MRLAVLDANVLVSAGIKEGGGPARLVMDWVLEGKVQLVTCPRVIRECREVMGREKFRRHLFPPAWLDFVVEESLLLPDPGPWPHVLPDPKDGPFLGLAHSAGAWLVAGNLKHFPESARAGVTVLSPAAYLAWLESGSAPR